MFTWNNGEYVESETYKKKVLSEPFLFEDIEDILRHISAQYNVEFHPQREHLKVMKHIIILFSFNR